MLQPDSRYFSCRGKRTTDGTIYLGERIPLNPGEILDGTEDTHIVQEGETLSHIASLYWTTGNEAPEDPGPESWFWIIAELNEIIDPTTEPKTGTVLLVPSLRTVQEKILYQ